MRRQRAWPTRCWITIQPVTGDPGEFYAVTWLGREKAVLMAAHADGRGHGSSNGIYDVLVHEIGPAGRDQNRWSSARACGCSRTPRQT